MTDIMLSAHSLCVTRGNKQVLKGISFDVAQGSVFALLGGNGAGKSTTLLTFLGFMDPTAGRVQVQGSDVHLDTASARASIAYLPETATLYEHLDAYENLTYLAQLAGKPASTAQIDAALDRVTLEQGARAERLHSYSKGMRQKVAIALALLRDTEILLLDEPTSGLDPIAIDEFHGLVRGLSAAGKTILMVTHDVYGACQVADRIGLLRRGELVGEFSATADERIDTERVHRAFSGQPST